jgi:hypothetical protein
MSRIRGPKDKEYGQKNLDEAPKTFSQRASERRAQNKVDAAKRGQKIKDFFTKKNPDSPGAQLAKRKKIKEIKEQEKATNKITMNIGKDTSKSKSGINTKKVGSRVRGPRDSIKTKPAAAATMGKPKTDTKPKPTSFADAFKQAKGKKTFEFKGKKYARVTADEVKKAGFASLKDYLNAPRKTQIAKK